MTYLYQGRAALAEEKDWQVADHWPAKALRRQANWVHQRHQAGDTAHCHELHQGHQPAGSAQPGHISDTWLAARDQPVQGGVREGRGPAGNGEPARNELGGGRAQAVLARAQGPFVSQGHVRPVHGGHANQPPDGYSVQCGSGGWQQLANRLVVA